MARLRPVLDRRLLLLVMVKLFAWAGIIWLALALLGTLAPVLPPR